MFIREAGAGELPDEEARVLDERNRDARHPRFPAAASPAEAIPGPAFEFFSRMKYNFLVREVDE